MPIREWLFDRVTQKIVNKCASIDNCGRLNVSGFRYGVVMGYCINHSNRSTTKQIINAPPG
jgi:GT2 family glycosyltransferase